jgi:hypothetical protein
LFIKIKQNESMMMMVVVGGGGGGDGDDDDDDDGSLELATYATGKQALSLARNSL